MYRNILVPTDGSKLSDRAIRAATQLAKVGASKLVLFHCVPPPIQMPVYADGMSIPHISKQKAYKAAVNKARRVLAAAARKVEAAGVAARNEYAITSSPHDAIVAAAQKRKCDLIVMASHGRRGLSRFLLGSVTQAVLSRTKVPVLVVR